MRHLAAHPLFRPLIALAVFLLTMLALKAHWRGLTASNRKGRVGDGRPGHGVSGVHPGDGEGSGRLVVGHFMLGNTYPYTVDDWQTTFDLAEDTSLDGLALNIGSEAWQLSQAQTAYLLVSARPAPSSGRPLKLFLSLDLNSLPPDPETLAENVITAIGPHKEVCLRYQRKIVLSTFGGHSLGDGWRQVIRMVEKGLKESVFFWPAFFQPPMDFLATDYVDGTFAWNSAWPMGDHPISLKEDEPFLKSDKPYMTAVSPLFFTHYGAEGQWAWNKNWIYRSDDLLLPTRFNSLLHLPANNSPDIIQLVSLNDYGESHYLFPVLGAQPGSEDWTDNMSHEGLRWVSKYFIGRWRDGKGEIEGYDDGVKVAIWYRTQPKDMMEAKDFVEKPDHAEWAQDLLNFVILTPNPGSTYTLHVQNGDMSHERSLKPGELNLLTVPFVAGRVKYQVEENTVTVVDAEGKEIKEGGRWNFNMWSGGVW